jgi:zinc protease
LRLEAGVPAIPPGVTLERLENGLTIIVREDHSAPVVSAQAWCMAGSIHEGKWLGAGLSHVLEHMLFKGTTKRPGSRIDQEVQEAGGYMNAYTSFDRTVYHIDVPNTGAVTAIDILCDIMQHASLPADELEKEKQVILREMDMNVDDPGRRASRRLFETAYTRSPYRFTVIGYPDIFHELTHADIQGYYLEKYAANNVFFVVAGDVKPADVVAQIKNDYSQSKAKAMEPVSLPEEPKQVAPREVIEEAPIELGYVHLAWHVPELRHADVPLLDLLAVLLGSGRSSRLYQQVREVKGLAHSVDAWTYSPGNPGLFGISAMLDGDKFQVGCDAILAELERVKTEGITAAELAKGVKQFVSSTLACRKTMQGQAQDLGGNWLAASDLNFSERYLQAVQRATAEEVQRVARQYLTPENRTLYALLPPGFTPQPTGQIQSAAEHPIQLISLPNGLRLLVKEDHRLPFVEFRSVFKGGLLAETPQTNGITQLMGRMLLKGTFTRSAEEIASEIESVGGHIDSYGGNNSFGVNAEVMSTDLEMGLRLLADVLLNPAFPAAALEREREVQLAALRSQKDHLLQSASKLMRRTLFGSAGYGLDVLGSEESLAALGPMELKDYHRRLAVPENSVLAIYGDVETARLQEMVRDALGGWKPTGGGTDPVKAAVAGPVVQGVRRVSEFRDKKQAVLVIGYTGTTLHSPERYPLELLQEACSDLGSRLFLRIREKLGLAYFVGAQNFIGLAPGYFAFYVGTTPEKADQVESEILREAEILRAEGLTEEELKRAKAKVIGQKKIARQDLGTFAMTTALDELYGLGYGYADCEDALYQGVTPEQVKAAAEKHLRADAVVVAVARPEG